MKKLILLLLVFPVVIVAILLFTNLKGKTIKPWGSVVKANSQVQGHGTKNAIIAARDSSAVRTSFVGERILAGYGDTNLPPENDLTLMSRLMDNAVLLLKSAANQPLSANEDWAAFLRGQNAAHERFLPDSSVAFNSKGQVIDRWSAPLFFHALGSGSYELRSAGPDGKLWTADDIHRDANGSFRHGNALNPASLFPANAAMGK